MGDVFSGAFETLTGHAPLSWQTRLFEEHFEKGDLPPVIDIPTGLGKTMVMAIWLIAREQLGIQIPTRLVYVVDRRTVVDQATDLAEDLQKRFGKDDEGRSKLSISTLRGQLADNREWSADPSRPAIIIGTVDLIGSALLFSGYRSSYKRRPLEAGLLGQDSLLVLDEAHLSKPFEKLIRAIGDDGSFQQNCDGSKQGKPMCVIRMSATSGDSIDSKPPFTLKVDANGNLTGEDAKDATLTERFGAKKRLTVEVSTDVIDSIANAAGKLAVQHPGSRVVIFVKSPKDVEAVRKALIKKDKSRDTKIAQLTGTTRGLERDELVAPPTREEQHERRVMQRFLHPDNDPSLGECFLVSTNAGEVGFDLNADHLVGDSAPLDSWIQRLGRVNRRGMGDATVVLIYEPIKTPARNGKPRKTEGLEQSIALTLELLKDVADVSPKNIAALRESEAWKEKYQDACSPEPTPRELTDILLDAWSMTSITDPMPGRPEVGPWLRGMDEGRAQTAITWRAELELFRDDASPEKALQAIFAKHSIRPHESLTVNTRYLIKEFLEKIPKLKERPYDLMSTRAAVRLSRGQIVCQTLQDLVVNPGILYAASTLILPATFGGVNAGMLDAESIPKVFKGGDAEPVSLDVADEKEYEQTDAARSRLRIVIKKTDGMWFAQPLPGGAPIPDDIKEKLKLSYEKTPALFNVFKDADLRVRLVQPVSLNDESEAIESLVLLAPAPKDKKKEDQSLTLHVGEVEKHATRIADALGLAGAVRDALLFAACWHDEGKKARIWQFFANGPMQDGQPKGKTAQARSPQTLKHHRHEFGSLLRIHPDYRDRCDEIECTLPSDETTRDLALHLIATHHGGGRPHFPTALYDPFDDAERDALHTDSIRRFARLQRKYGWWHLAWLENLLRCADQLASADEEVTQIDELDGGES